MTLAVAGSTGVLGGMVARALRTRGLNPRLVVRDPARAPQWSSADVAVAAYEDVEAMARALDGVETFFMVSGHEDPDRIALHRRVVDAAQRAGV